MDTSDIRPIDLRYRSDREQLSRFLASNGLALDDDVEAAFGLFDGDGEMHACGCAAGMLLKCFAVDEMLRGQNVLGGLVSALTQERFDAGVARLLVVTRVKNEAAFVGCGMHRVAEAEGVIMLENSSDGPERYAAPLREDSPPPVGAAVMNCNPFTLGHRSLIERAAAECSLLHVFVVAEDRSRFAAADRLALVRAGTSDLPNVRVHESGIYMISRATFPTYFLKSGEDPDAMCGALDAAVFGRRIAPALAITRRYVGTEPIDRTTASYNEALLRVLPPLGVEVRVLERAESGCSPISASRVRALIDSGAPMSEIEALVPPPTADFIRAKFYAGGI